jgi:hypothetical protein
MSDPDWDIIEKNILSTLVNDGDHLVLKYDDRKRKNGPKLLTINGKPRLIHHWIYICKNKLNIDASINLKNLCDNKTCVNLKHWLNLDNQDAVYNIALHNLKNNSVQQGNCLLYSGAKDSYGYGYATFNGKSSRAHIVSILSSKKIMEIPKGYVVRHKCLNKNCIAPDHLELGTQKENMLDKIRDGTMQRGSDKSNASLNENKAKEIYETKDSKMTQRERANKFCVSLNVIKDIDRGRTWSHVTGNKDLYVRPVITIDENTPIKIFDSAKEIILNSVIYVNDVTTNTTHWLWAKSKCKLGYGTCKFRGRMMMAHRLSWIAFNKKPIPEGLLILHRCKQTRDCVNPNHLYVGTQKENMDDVKKDGTRKSRSKVNDENIQKIVESRGTGTALERSIRFGVSEATVKGIDKKSLKLIKNIDNLDIDDMKINEKSNISIKPKLKQNIKPKIKLKSAVEINPIEIKSN